MLMNTEHGLYPNHQRHKTHLLLLFRRRPLSVGDGGSN
jgi:hypothetical protein